MKRQHMVLSGVGLVILFCAFPGHAQEKEVATPALQGQGLFIENCSTCHKNANEAPKAPSQQTLIQMMPESVFLKQVRALAALYLATGERKWVAPIQMADFPGRPFVFGASAAVTALPGVIFSGAWDGVLRALSAEDGHVLWEYDTMKEFTTVNGVTAKGGSMGAPGPTVAGGMVFVGSGYVGAIGGFPGNVLLAFSPE